MDSLTGSDRDHLSCAGLKFASSTINNDLGFESGANGGTGAWTFSTITDASNFIISWRCDVSYE